MQDLQVHDAMAANAKRNDCHTEAKPLGRHTQQTTVQPDWSTFVTSCLRQQDKRGMPSVRSSKA